MRRDYILRHFDDIRAHANDIEQRLDDSDCTMESVLEDNERYLAMCREHRVEPTLIDGNDQVDLELT